MERTLTGRKIAIVGASGHLGKPTLKALLSKGVHTITAIQRNESTSNFPSEVLVKRGSFEDESFLVDALRGQDAVVVIVPIPNMDLGDLFVRAAAKAGVPYILPTEFGVDAPEVENEHSMMAPKVARRRLVEELGVSSWIAVIVNFWLDVNIQIGLWGIDVKDRKVELFKNAEAKVSTTTVSRSGEVIAALLSLPETELAQYKNKSYYYSSFELSQRDIFEAVKRATGTQDADWDIRERDAAQVIAEAEPKIRQGDGYAEWYRLFAKFFQGFKGGNYEDKAIDLEKYGLPKENLDVVVKQAIAEL
ncbi:hypothetical protein TGAMA5MH_06035 [Trichoderma gamsii]|uniref:NmrA-like domain-containing protein n=1 Tax=Trichoderma gamsii TaxID=398673 RepID=A0A2K0TA09_9HYPO|nr:hypothetical protein TGAMA5MH_06035 [Trichoderma gamsii]